MSLSVDKEEPERSRTSPTPRPPPPMSAWLREGEGRSSVQWGAAEAHCVHLHLYEYVFIFVWVDGFMVTSERAAAFCRTRSSSPGRRHVYLDPGLRPSRPNITQVAGAGENLGSATLWVSGPEAGPAPCCKDSHVQTSAPTLRTCLESRSSPGKIPGLWVAARMPGSAWGRRLAGPRCPRSRPDHPPPDSTPLSVSGLTSPQRGLWWAGCSPAKAGPGRLGVEFPQAAWRK